MNNAKLATDLKTANTSNFALKFAFIFDNCNNICCSSNKITHKFNPC
jgi:hypothetical protein